MSKYICRICRNLVFSQAVTFAGDTLTINIPPGSYQSNRQYCIVVAQAIPEETTITAPVVITIGTGTEEYPLLGRNGAQIVAASLRTRTRYATCVATDSTGGVFRLLGKPHCAPYNPLQAIDGTAPETPAAGGDGA